MISAVFRETGVIRAREAVAAVDAADKVQAWRNWLQLMQGTLAEEVKGGLGLTFPPEDPAAIAEVLRRAADPDVYNSMAEAVAARPKDLEGEWAGYVEQLLGGRS